jgi:hypothetical protein
MVLALARVSEGAGPNALEAVGISAMELAILLYD